MLDSLSGFYCLDDMRFFPKPVLGNDQADVTADRLAGRIAEDSLRGCVPRRNRAIQIFADDGIGR